MARIQNTQEIKRTLFNWTKQVLLHILSCFIQLKIVLFISCVLHVLSCFQNTQEIKRTLFNWTKQVLLHVLSCFVQLKIVLFNLLCVARFVLFRPIKKRSFNLLCVLDLFLSERWQSTLFQIFLLNK